MKSKETLIREIKELQERIQKLEDREEKLTDQLMERISPPKTN